MTSSNKQRFFPESQFGGFTDIDGTISFYTRVGALLHENSVVVDFGCGRGGYGKDRIDARRNLRLLRGKVSNVIGLDVDTSAGTNPYIDEFHLIKNNSWPLQDDSIDLCICDNVLEHLSKPELFFKECRRVMKSGGFLCIRTPNKWNYIALASRLIPERFHARILSRVQNDRCVSDIFPAFYLCNSMPELRRSLAKNSFEGVVYGYDAEPSYLSFSKPLYFFGVLHQRFAPRFLKSAIFAFAKLNK